MIEVVYDGNLGNNLFQYCFGRLLAERLGYRLIAEPILGFSRTNDVVDGFAYDNGRTLILRGQKPDLGFLYENNPQYRILLTGYFQRTEYYQAHRGRIKQWLAMDHGADDICVKPSDIVVGVRRGRDYIPRHGLPLSYYESALASIGYERIFICTDSPSDPLVKYLKKSYDAIVRPPGALDNLAFIIRFKKIIISNSTFLWWGAFLSDADRIVFPRPNNGFWSANEVLSKNIALEVDSPEYVYLDCEKYVSKFARERIANFADDSIANIRHYLKNIFPFLASRKVPPPTYRFSEDFDEDPRK